MTTKTISNWQEVVALAKNNGCEFVDLKFVDLPGLWQHFTIPATDLTEELFKRRHRV